MNFLKKEITTSTGLIAIFGAAVILFGGAITYYYRMAPTTYDYEVHDSTITKTSTDSRSSTTTSTSATAAETNSTSTNAPATVPASNATSATTPAIAPTSIAYSNTDYGFALTLPASWEKYKVKKTVVEGEVATYYFELPTTDPLHVNATSTADAGYFSVFAIGVLNKSDWTGDELQVRDSGEKVGENASYVFTYSRAQANAQDLPTVFDDLKSIIESFKLN